MINIGTSFQLIIFWIRMIDDVYMMTLSSQLQFVLVRRQIFVRYKLQLVLLNELFGDYVTQNFVAVRIDV